MSSWLQTSSDLLARAQCRRCGSRWSVEGYLWREALWLLLFPLLLAAVFAHVLEERFVTPRSWQAVRGTLVEARLGSGLAPGKSSHGVSYSVRYSVAGEDYLHHRTDAGLTREEAEAELRLATLGRPEQLYVLKEDPSSSRTDLDFGTPWVWASLGVMAVAIAMLLNEFSQRLHDMQRHHVEHSAPRALLANFDRRPLGRPRLLGPIYSRPAILGLLFVAGALIVNVFWPHPALFWLTLLTPLTWLGYPRLLREFQVFARWSGVKLEPAENAPFELGRTYVYRFKGSPRRWRGARLEFRVEAPGPFGVWGGRVAAQAPIEVSDGELRVTLPHDVGPSLGVQPRWRLEERERWTIAVSGRVHFDLDFAPTHPPEEREFSLGLPALELIRDEVKEPPRAIPKHILAKANETQIPEWAAGAAYAEVYERISLLLREGRVVWGAIVQANANLYEAGEEDHPAMVLYSRDPHFADHPDQLRAMARRLFDTKRSPVDRISHVIADEHTDVFQHPLAQWLAGEREVWASSLMVIRRHLPRGFLARRVVPLLIAPRKTPMVLILPSHFWPPELTRWWDRA